MTRVAWIGNVYGAVYVLGLIGKYVSIAVTGGVDGVMTTASVAETFCRGKPAGMVMPVG